MKYDFKLEYNPNIPLHEAVYETLRRAILTGSLAPGDRLMEIHLSNHLGVSRTPVREAIHLLEQDKLVVIRPARGAVVAGISIDGMQDALEIRRALDTLCSQLACLRMSQEELNQLEKACKEFEKAVAEGSDITRIAACDVEFHDIINHATRNARLIDLINNISEEIYRYRFEYLKDKDKYGELIREHRAIYEAIASRNEEAAAQASGVHIDNQELAIMRHIALGTEPL